MNRMVWSAITLLLVLPALPAQDKPKEGTPREQFQALAKEFSTQQSQLIGKIQKAQGEERTQLITQYRELGKSFGAKFYKLAEDHPQDPAATDALFWIVQNGPPTSPVYKQALEKVKAAVAQMPLRDLLRRVQNTFVNPEVVEAVYARAEKEENAPETPDLLAWVASMAGRVPAGQKALDRLLTKYADHAAVEKVCGMLARSRSPQDLAKLEKLIEASPKPSTRAAAVLALAQVKAAQVDRMANNPTEADKLTAEAEKLYQRVIDEFGKDAPQHKDTAERELKAMNIRAGKPAPEITGTDLDGKEIKLSDYRGKVVLLDFWGNW
jgi:hypothetical protein